MPSRDFVLYLRDEGISTLSAISSKSLSGQQAISLKVLPDYRAKNVKERVARDLTVNVAYNAG